MHLQTRCSYEFSEINLKVLGLVRQQGRNPRRWNLPTKGARAGERSSDPNYSFESGKGILWEIVNCRSVGRRELGMAVGSGFFRGRVLSPLRLAAYVNTQHIVKRHKSDAANVAAFASAALFFGAFSAATSLDVLRHSNFALISDDRKSFIVVIRRALTDCDAPGLKSFALAIVADFCHTVCPKTITRPMSAWVIPAGRDNPIQSPHRLRAILARAESPF